MSNKEVDTSISETSFMAIFAPRLGETFFQVNHYQIKQATRSVGMALLSVGVYKQFFAPLENLILQNQEKDLFLMTFMV